MALLKAWCSALLLRTFWQPSRGFPTGHEQERSSTFLASQPRQIHTHLRSAGKGESLAWSLESDSVHPQSCSTLKNHGTHSTVEVEVGSPGQKFDVIVDTGSDAIIVPSCTCQQRHVCDTTDRCFTGSNRSSTFSVAHVEGTSGERKEPDFPVLTLSFGSGDITVAVTTDVVKVGPAVKATMRNSLLLMLERDWAMHHSFEGILGLGLPDTDYGSLDPDVAIVELPKGTKREGPSLKGFLREAGLRRFSLCFNDDSDGALVMGGPPLQGVSLGTVGQLHWGLDFQGVTVGGSTYPAQFCQSETKRSWQGTACGAIPDSGTTLILAPKKQLDLLLADICDHWERCRSNLTDASLEHKSAMFMTLLDRCTEWVKVPHAEGLQELPDLHFHLAGKNGEKHSLQLTSWAYIIWSEEGACKPAFGTIQYETSINGPIWILGTPIFYEYRVGFELGKHPPAVSFSSEPCPSCSSTKSTALVAESKRVGQTSTTFVEGRQMRRITGPFRSPMIDTTGRL